MADRQQIIGGEFVLFDDSLVYQSQHTRRLIVTNYSNFRSNDVSYLIDSFMYSISINIRILYISNSLIFDLSIEFNLVF